MNTHYTIERHTQILIALMKFHGIRKVVASPGTTNICLNASLQSDPYFEIYSSVDERSAAYIACGLAAESGEPVALSCTGATASRNYVPGLTEAFYRKLPVLAITATQDLSRVGNAFSQVVDRSRPMPDMVMESVLVDVVHSPTDEWARGVAINKALIALRKNGGGPAHINLVTTYSPDFSVTELPKVKGISHIESLSRMPSLSGYKRVAILVGVHDRWTEELQKSVDKFCELYNGVVLMYHACNYKGAYGVNHSLIINMKHYDSSALRTADLVIYIGSIPRYPSGIKRSGSEMWRVNPDGVIRDPERTLTKVFAMSEQDFFDYYTNGKSSGGESLYARQWQEEYESIISQKPEVPFSNVWLAEHTIGKLPEGCVVHIAGSNTARAWNFFRLPKSVECYSNDGAMGIDGQVSSLIGESLAAPKRLHFGVVGDLTFFYDMNSIGNHHVGNNLRLIVVNNGMGGEFRIYTHLAYKFGEEAKPFMAAAGHFGNRSPRLLKHYAEDLGFEYLTASNEEEYLKNLDRFLTPHLTEKPMFFEVFTVDKNENDAIYAMNHIVQKLPPRSPKRIIKDAVKAVIGEKATGIIKDVLGK